MNRTGFQLLHFGTQLRDFAALAGERALSAGPIPVPALLQREVVDEAARPRDLRHPSGLLGRRVETEEDGLAFDHERHDNIGL